MEASAAPPAPPPPPPPQAPGLRPFAEKLELLEAAVADADKGVITNAKKMEGLASLEELIPAIPREEILKQQGQLEDLCERLLSQNATEPLRRLVVSVLNCVYQFGNSSGLPTFVGKLLKLTGEEKNKKIATDTKVAALDVMGELILHHGRSLEHFSTDIFVVVAKHMKLNEASARCSAFQCLRKVMRVAGVKSISIAGNIWKMLQKMLLDKAVTVRACAAHALADLASASPPCAGQNGDAMAVGCLKALATDDQAGQASALGSECRFAFCMALAHVLAAMATPSAYAPEDRPKKKPEVTDLASAVVFLEKAATKGPPSGPLFVAFRASICLSAVRLLEVLNVDDAPSIALVMRMLVAILDSPQQTKASRGSTSSSAADDDCLAQVGRYVSGALRKLLLLSASEAALLEVIEMGLIPLASSQFSATSQNTDARMVVVLEALSDAIVAAGEVFRGAESKVSKPLLHLVGNHPNPMVQLHATYCLRVVARTSPPQLFLIMSFLLNLATVQNAELLGTPLPKKVPGASNAGPKAPDLQPLMHGLFGHCVALASLVGELYHSDLGVPHDVTNAVLNTSRALLQPHLNTTVSAQRRSCAFILLEGLMCLGTDWVGQRLTTLFALWKAALGKKPVDRAKVLHQQHVASSSPDSGSGLEGTSGACRDELLSLLCALRSLHAFTVHSHETLLVSLPHLHKILVVFLTHVSQLVVALPHPTSASLRAKYRSEIAPGPGQPRPIITLAVQCGIPDILLMIRSTMYRCFAVTQYSQRFVPLLNMLADDVTRAPPTDFPVAEFVAHYLSTDDLILDLVDPYTESGRDGAAAVRLAAARLLSIGTGLEGSEKDSGDNVQDLFSDAAASSFFSGAPREGPGSVDGLMTPWDAWANPAKSMASQCSSPEWEWRCSAVALLAIIMNSNEVSEAPRSAVLTHLLKKREAAEDSSGHGKKGGQPHGELGVVPCIAILTYLREHVKARGIKCGPPAGPAEQILQASLEGLKEANPAVRRLHVEILALLFYIHHRLPESPIVPSILQFVSQETTSDSAAVRSALALLCGSVLRAFDWGNALLTPPGAPKPQSLHCPYLMQIVPCLLKLAKETAQPVRLWMLHSLHLSMQAAKQGFAPFLKESLRLATAHLLADFFESPLVLWTVGELVHSAASIPPVDAGGSSPQEENTQRILGIWSVLKHMQYAGAGSGLAFATVRTEVLCVSTARAVAQLAPRALSQLKDIFELLSAKLAPRRRGGSLSPAVRTEAAQSLTALVGPGAGLGQIASITKEPSQLFMLLDEGTRSEAKALQQLVVALVNQRGLVQLPMWLRTFKETILALPPKGSGPLASTADSSAKEKDDETDAHDDGASMAGPGSAPSAGGDEKRRPPSGASKVFAVSCLQMLIEQADPSDASHFQVDLPSGSPSHSEASKPGVDCRLVTHLDSLVALAAHASGSDEPSLAAVGLKLALLIVNRFRLTRDVHGQIDEEECPLLLVQYEAQITTCIRHNMSASANPRVQGLALELLRDVIAARACNSVQPLTTKLLQPFGSALFEPDEKYCECASTKTFLFRLRSACEILDSTFEEQAIGSHVKDLARWMESAMRDCAVLLAGFPLQSIKTYQPACFSLADYKAVQPFFREALPPILRGVCVLCGDPKANSPCVSSDFVVLALGIIVLLLSDKAHEPAEAELKVYIRTVKQVLQFVAAASPTGTETGLGATVTTAYLLDLLKCLWHRLFRVPARCVALLPDFLELLHAMSASIFRQRQKQEAPVLGAPSEVMWLHGLCQDTDEGRSARGTVGAYALHAVAAALRDSQVMADAARVSQALEIFVLWLGDALAESLEAACLEGAGAGAAREGGKGEEEQQDAEDEDDEIVAAALEGEDMPGTPGARRRSRCYWLWLLFLSPFPADMVHSQPAITLKFWKIVCNLLCKPGQSGAQSDRQLLYLSLITRKLCRSLLLALDNPDAEERNILYWFAMLVPAVTSVCTVLQHVSSGTGGPAFQLGAGARAAGAQCLADVQVVFDKGLRHQMPKVVQTSISSAQSLVQNPTCLMLCPALLPSLTAVFVSPDAPAAALDGAWGAVTAMLAAQQVAGGLAFMQATTQMVLKTVLAVLEFSSLQPGSFVAHTSAMARCLVQVARTDAQGVKAEVAAMSPERQAIIQQLLREHMSAAGAGGPGAAGAGAPGAAGAAGAAPKISLKLKF